MLIVVQIDKSDSFIAKAWMALTFGIFIWETLKCLQFLLIKSLLIHSPEEDHLQQRWTVGQCLNE